MNSNPYKFTVKGVTFDFYDLSDAIQFEQAAVEHAVKKLVALGKRSGNKSYGQDLHEAIMSLLRAQEQHNESLLRTAGSSRKTIGDSSKRYKVELPPLGPLPIHKGPVNPGTGALTSLGSRTSPSITDDPNDIEQAVQFIWKLAYSNQDNGPL